MIAIIIACFVLCISKKAAKRAGPAPKKTRRATKNNSNSFDHDSFYSRFGRTAPRSHPGSFPFPMDDGFMSHARIIPL